MDELKPCPFCGGEGCVELEDQCGGMGLFVTVVHVTCKKCGAKGGAFDSYSHTKHEVLLKALAIDSWNKRANDEGRAEYDD